MTQEEALTILKTGANVFLTGEPGSGKTHTINRYVSYLRLRGVEPAITASTGIAATHIGGFTIHSWSGIGIRPFLTEYDLEDIANKERLASRIMNAKVLIIDEISMLSGQTLSMIDAVCRAVRRVQQPFGGLQVVFVGDFFQLPPIVKSAKAPRTIFEDEERSSPFAFHCHNWEEANPIVCYLSEQHRQEDTVFLDVLSAIRSGSVDRGHEITLQDRFLEESERAELSIPKLFTHNIDVDRINEGELVKIQQSARTFIMDGRGADALVDHLKRGCLSPETLVLKEGAKVMFTKNDFDGRFVNGTLGTVISFEKESGAPIVQTFLGERITAHPLEWTISDGGKILAKITQVPLRLAWAMTVHKSQGMSLDAAFVDLSEAFEYGQGYVALSRVRTLAGLFLGGINERALLVHPEVQKEDRSLREKSKEARQVFADMGQEKINSLHQNFMRAIGGSLTEISSKKKAAKSTSDQKEGETYLERLARLRQTHPKAYMPWDADEDKKLRDAFEEGTSINELAVRFERKSGAIRSRLKKFGLISD